LTELAAPNCRTGELAVVACYDGWWWNNVARYIRHARAGVQISFAGYHDVLRWHISRLSHQPALTCCQAACGKRADAVVLMSGDGDLAPLAARIKELRVELVVPVTNYRFPNGTSTHCRTSNLLLRHATSAPEFTDLIDAGQSSSYPPGLRRPLISDRHNAGQRREGTVGIWRHSMGYGYIMAADGQTWYANADGVSDGAGLREGRTVTFTGSAVAPEGRSYPRARDIRARAEDEQSKLGR
jgi:cold shock CspA family protein